jgi:hypothetical protein
MKCAGCGGGFPGDVPDGEVCKCGSAWAKPKAKGLQRRTALKQGSGLARGGPLKRTGPIKQTATLKRTGPIARTVPAPKKAKAKPRRAGESSDIPAAVRAVVLARCKGLCEACGGTLAGAPVHMHHRKKRTKRNHVACNIVALHPACHVIAPGAVHQEPTWAEQRGLIVLAGEDPAVKPLTMPNGDLVLLDPVEPAYLPLPEMYAA